MLKSDFYQSLKINSMDKIKELNGTLVLDHNSNGVTFKTPYTLDTDYIYSVHVSIVRNVTTLITKDGHGTVINTCYNDWNNQFINNMVTITRDQVLMELGLIK